MKLSDSRKKSCRSQHVDAQMQQLDEMRSGDDKMKREITWTTGSGNEILISFRAGFELNAHGRERDGGRMRVHVRAYVDKVPHFGFLQPVSHPIAVARFGDIGLTAERKAEYDKAYAAVADSFATHNADCDAHAAALDRVSEDGEHIAEVMAYGECDRRRG